MFCHKYHNKYTKNRAIKKGDTLIEVTLAVGIFSMVAVAVLAVMNGSASSAQTALEATLTREEIDAQADALRFIHSAYVADKNNQQLAVGKEQTLANINTNFANLWRAIISNPAPESSVSNNYPPSTCDAFYSGTDSPIGNAFILDAHQLASVNTDSVLNEGAINNIVIKHSNSPGVFKPATTYPHLVYTDSDSSNTSLLAKDDIRGAAEGIYIIPVPEQVSGEATPNYYDFYIRSCWYGIGDRDSAPSTISTVMRLYNPDSVKPITVATCDEEYNYVMVDTNIYINGTAADDFNHHGVSGVKLDFNLDSNVGDGINTGDHVKCLNRNSPGLVRNDSNTLEFTGPSSSCATGYERVKVRTGNGSSVDQNLELDTKRDNGGDFWYPVHVGDTIKITLKSQDLKMFYHDTSGSAKNPFICNKEGVVCRFCEAESLTDTCDNHKGSTTQYYEGDVNSSTASRIDGKNRLEISIKVSGCIPSADETTFNNLPKINVNTYWTNSSF